MADKHKLEWENSVPFSKIVATQDENGEHLIGEMPAIWAQEPKEESLLSEGVLTARIAQIRFEQQHGTSYGVNDIEGKEVLLLTGAELCEHYEKLRLAYLELLKKYNGETTNKQ